MINPLFGFSTHYNPFASTCFFPPYEVNPLTLPNINFPNHHQSSGLPNLSKTEERTDLSGPIKSEILTKSPIY